MKKNRNKKRSRKNLPGPPTKEQINKVMILVNEMIRCLDRAVLTSKKLSRERLSKDDDLYWALVKHAENVQECVTQLDNLNKTIYPALIEIPEKSSDGKELSWGGLKGMRNLLAHKFWNIDDNILWDTATIDFPILVKFLKSMIVYPEVIYGRFSFSISVPKLMNLKRVGDGDRLGLDNSIPVLFVNGNGQAQTIRVGWKSNKQLCMSGAGGEPLTLTEIWGVKKHSGSTQDGI